MPRSALDGIRILDLTTIVFGPYASQTLADYGAEVIKIESPQGDSTRYIGPSYEQGLSAFYLSVNRNKKSVVIDLKTKKGIEIMHQLIKTADVLIHNIRPQKMKKLGLNYESLKTMNPMLIYAGLYGFGTEGCYSGRPAYDDIVQGLSGIPDIIKKQTGKARYMPQIIADKASGLIATNSILAALYQRNQIGEGQKIEVPMFEATVSFSLLEHFYDQHLIDLPKQKKGYERVISDRRQPYETTDGYVCMTPYTDEHWQKFFINTGNQDYAEDPRFENLSKRTENINELYDLTNQIISKNSTEYWKKFAEELDIPFAPVNTLENIELDPHLIESKMFVVIHDETGNYKFIRNPAQFEKSEVKIKMPPKLGEHTTLILEDLGFNKGEIQQLYKEKIVH